MPFSTYAPGSQIKSADLNALIAGKHTARTLVIPGYNMFPVSATTQADRSAAGISQPGGSLPGWGVGLNLRIGSRILAVRALVRDSATGPTLLKVQLKKHVASTDAVSTIVSSANSTGSGALQTLNTGAVSETILSGVTYSVEVNPGAGGVATVRVHVIEVDFDDLP